MYGYIYKTTDSVTGKIYIGKCHSSTFKGIDYIGSGNIIQRIREKCLREGVKISERFEVDMIDTAESLDELNFKEKYWIKELDARNPEIGYNLRAGGDCGPGGPMMLGHKHSEETKAKMSRDRMGANNSNYGNRWHQSDELRKLHSELSSGERNGMYGKRQSEEQKAKSRAKHIGKIAVSNIELDIVKMIYPDELDYYLNSGWIKKNIHRTGNQYK